METMDIMDVRAEKAFLELLLRGYLAIIEPGRDGGNRLYRSVVNADMSLLNRDELIILHQARWPDTSAKIIHRASGKFRLSNQVRWSAGRHIKDVGETTVIAGVTL